VKKQKKKPEDWIEYYESGNILDEIIDESVDLTLDKRLRQDITGGKRKRKLKNVTIKIDPLQIIAIKKLANMKSIPYQTLIRHWLAQDIKEELEKEQKRVTS